VILKKVVSYLPALLFGILLAGMSLIAFDFAASYMLGFLLSNTDMHSNSSEFLWLLIHDVGLSLLLAAGVYFSYRKILPKFPNDIFAVLLMQAPLAYISIYLFSPSFDFSSLYSSVSSVLGVTSAVAVLLVYWMSKVFGLGSKVTL
jgi:hypothetical protein